MIYTQVRETGQRMHLERYKYIQRQLKVLGCQSVDGGQTFESFDSQRRFEKQILKWEAIADPPATVKDFLTYRDLKKYFRQHYGTLDGAPVVYFGLPWERQPKKLV
jgi:hypothetical protein